uniref:Anaphase-promoting complex subunit 4 WD40 domain-containing protein n=1 Tax=Prasinoderma coloniale TaxID=156133 RepID=A0A7R9XVW1_9VIRI|eukprot:PRCOL_00006870-RA
MAFGAAAVGGAGHNPAKSFEVPSPPSDGVSSLAFSPAANHLVATSWDNQARLWEVLPTGQSQPKASVAAEQPLLCSAWSADGTAVFLGGCDKQAKLWSVASGATTAQVVGQHDAPICSMAWIEELKLLATGSWDKTVKYWDTRSPTPAHTQQLPERCYAMDVRQSLMVVATAERHICIINLKTPQQIYKTIQSPLKYQTRCVSCFPDQTGFLVGSIEGRVAVHHVEDSQQGRNFTFKCHRDNADVYAVNSIAFHPTYGTFATAGADGAFNFWDKDSKQRLKAMPRANAPIPCGTFNRDGSIYAYAVSYDWSKGAQGHQPQVAKNHVLLHATQDSEVKSRQKKR